MAQQRVTQAVLYQELQTIKETIQRHTETDNMNFQAIRDDFQDLRHMLEGTDASPGMKIRLDRIEQREESRKQHFGYIWAAISTLTAGSLLKLWFG